MSQKEAKARIKINKMLEEAGWHLLDDSDHRCNVTYETSCKITERFNELGEDFEKTQNGFADFVLLDNYEKPLIVLEAKSEDKDPLIGKEQARKYAKALNVKYVILSNGNIHYFWNIYNGNPQIIVAFPTEESIASRKALSYDKEALINEDVEDDYIALTMFDKYFEMPEYKNEETRSAFIEKNKLRFLRTYQQLAIKAIQNGVKQGDSRFLLEMATGTGKTMVSAGVIKLFLRTGNAKRILFLVDRIELETQAEKNFRAYLKNDYTIYKFKEHRDDWKTADIIVCTAQTLLSNNTYRKYFKPTDFDLVISDEAHRSINGNSRALFEYFCGYKLGLTATPKDYIKNVDVNKMQKKDPRAWERRQMLDTYKTFGCESGEPTYRYSLTDGVKDGFLINPYVLDCRTDITTQLLADKGYAVMVEGDDEGDEREETFFQKDFEKKFFSDETNYTFCKTFMTKAKRDPLSGEIGKTIIFCVSRRHAGKITNMLNELAFKMHPDKYNESDFAMQITSDVPNVQNYTANFVDDANNLSGRTTFLENYRSSKTRICVTVGMMTTGYDCQDLLNIVLMRPIFSPSDFVQIKGRGTRKYTFSYTMFETEEQLKQEKDRFHLFDYFGNVEYFEKKHDYDEIVKLPQFSKGAEGTVEPPVGTEEYENFLLDPIKTIEEMQIGVEGMRIDRELFSKFEEVVKNDPIAKDKYENSDISELIRYVDEKIMNKPNEYFSWEKLRRALSIDRKLTKQEMLDKVFGAIQEFASQNMLVNQEFEKFILVNQAEINNENVLVFKKFFDAYLTNKAVRMCIDDSQKRRDLITNQIYSYTDLQELGKDRMDFVVEYIFDNVDLRRFVG